MRLPVSRLVLMVKVELVDQTFSLGGLGGDGAVVGGAQCWSGWRVLVTLGSLFESSCHQNSRLVLSRAVFGGGGGGGVG